MFMTAVVDTERGPHVTVQEVTDSQQNNDAAVFIAGTPCHPSRRPMTFSGNA